MIATNINDTLYDETKLWYNKSGEKDEKMDINTNITN